MTTRQQKRQRARVPIKKERPGYVFPVVATLLLLAGVAAIVALRQNPPELTRGALTTDHWHAPYKLEICGSPVQPFPNTEGEIHTHGDAQIHAHPHTPAYTGDNANLGAFFESTQSTIGVDENGRRFLSLPDGKTYTDGDTCEGIEGKQELVVLVNDEPFEGDPHTILIHDEDEIVIRFGPEPKPGTPPIPNPLIELQQQFMQQQEQMMEQQGDDAQGEGQSTQQGDDAQGEGQPTQPE